MNRNSVRLSRQKHVFVRAGLLSILLGVLPAALSPRPALADDPPAAKSRPQLVLRIGHVGEITATAFSPDGKWLASVSRDQTAKLWDAETGDLVQTFTDSPSPLLVAAFSTEGRVLLTGDATGVVDSWDVQNGTQLGQWRGPAGPVSAAALWAGGVKSPSLLVAVVTGENTLQLWKGDDSLSGQGTLVETLTGHEKPVRALAFSPDGKLLASGSDDGIVKLWDTEDGSLQRTLQRHAMPIRALAFSADSKTLADGCDDGIAQLWDVAGGKPLDELQMNRPGDGIDSVAFSPDGKNIATGGQGGVKGNEYVLLWDAQTHKILRPLLGHEASATAVAFSPQGKLATGSRDAALRIWETSTGKGKLAGAGMSYLDAVAYSPGGDQIASAGADGAVRLWNSQTGELTRTFAGHTGLVKSVGFSKKGDVLASGGEDGTIRLWESESGKPLQVFKSEAGPVNAVAFSSDGALLAAGTGASISDGAIQLWELSTGKLKKTLSGESLGKVNALAFSPDGSALLSGSGTTGGGETRFWDVQTGQILKKDFSRGVRAVAFTTDGKTAASGGVVLNDAGEPSGEEIKLWNGKTQALQRTLTATDAEGGVNALAFSPDKTVLVSGSRNGALHLWNPKSGEKLQTLKGHLGSALSVAVSPDGFTAASAGRDNTLRFWSLPGGRLLATDTLVPSLSAEAVSHDWIVVTPEGFYDGSPGTDRLIQWKMGAVSYPAEAFERILHRPDALRKILRDRESPAAPESGRFVAGTDIPPLIAFAHPEDGQQVTEDHIDVDLALAEGRKISRIDLLVNGRPVDAKPIFVGAKPIFVGAKPIFVGAKPIFVGAKPIFVGAKPIFVGAKSVAPAQKMGSEYQAKVPLPPGESYLTLTALAYDDQELQARDEIHLVRPSAVPKTGKLTVLAVGVSQYKNPHYNLKYASQDAEAFAGLWKTAEGKLYSQVDVTRLTDDQATSGNIRAALFKLLETATEGDTVAIFLSGHGVQVSEGDYYYASQEIDASTPDTIAKTALPWTAFQTTLSGLKAHRVLMFLDACHSGNALGGQQASNERLAEMLVKHAGVMVFSSSRGSEYSYELDDVKHGAFTAALMEGLGEGKADLDIGGKRDGVITAEELLAFLRARVPQMTENKQTPSCPLLRDFGEAFPLTTAKPG